MNVYLRSAITLGLSAAALAAHAQFNSNLVVNGDAESGAGSPSGDIVAVRGWTTTGNATATTYSGSSFPGPTDPGPSNRGANFFAGGPDNAASSLSQSIALGFGTSTIDAGRATYSLASYLGGFSSQNDNAVLTATFLNALGATLGTGSIGPVTASDRNNATGLLARSTSGTVPVGARSVNLTLSFTRTDGTYNDGYADNVSLVLGGSNPTPEPSALAALGLGAVAFARKRRKG